MTYYPVNSMLVSMPTATNTTVGSSSSQFHLPNNLNNLSSSSSSSGGPPPAPPPPPPPTSLPPGALGGAGGYTSTLLQNSKTLSVHHPKPTDFHNFTTTVHRSQKIYLQTYFDPTDSLLKNHINDDDDDNNNTTNTCLLRVNEPTQTFCTKQWRRQSKAKNLTKCYEMTPECRYPSGKRSEINLLFSIAMITQSLTH